jgi:cytochrome c peroxidase
MWDGAINHLDMQALAPISDSAEMGENLVHVIAKLQAKKPYPSLFRDAFGDSLITGERLLKAIAQFQLTLVSSGAKYDEVKAGSAIFSAQEAKGYSLFQQHCNTCHTEPLFSSYAFENNGLPVDTILNDYGRGSITQRQEDSLTFKVPSLRNLSYTYPYMHDGRFRKLSQVLQHYTDDSRAPDFLNKEQLNPMNLSANEKTDLIAFLLTLDDKAFVFDPKHQFPREILLSK